MFNIALETTHRQFGVTEHRDVADDKVFFIYGNFQLLMKDFRGNVPSVSNLPAAKDALSCLRTHLITIIVLGKYFDIDTRYYDALVHFVLDLYLLMHCNLSHFVKLHLHKKFSVWSYAVVAKCFCVSWASTL